MEGSDIDAAPAAVDDRASAPATGRASQPMTCPCLHRIGGSGISDRALSQGQTWGPLASLRDASDEAGTRESAIVIYQGEYIGRSDRSS